MCGRADDPSMHDELIRAGDRAYCALSYPHHSHDVGTIEDDGPVWTRCPGVPAPKEDLRLTD